MPAMASAESLAARRAKTGEMRPAACPLSRQVRSFVVTRIRGLKRAWSSLSDSHDTSSKRALWTIARAFRSALLIQPLSHSPKRVEYEETRASSRRDEDDESGDGQGDLRDGVASVVVPVVLVPVLLARDVLCARRGLSQEGGRVTRLLRLVQSPSEEQVAGLLRLCRSRKVFKSRMSAVSGVDDGTLQSPTTRDPGANPPRTLERASPERLPRSTTRLCRARFASLVDRFFKTQYNRFLKLSQIARNNEPRRDTLLNCATSSASCASLSARAMASSLATPSPVSTHSSAVSCCGVSPVRGRGLKKKNLTTRDHGIFARTLVRRGVLEELDRQVVVLSARRPGVAEVTRVAYPPPKRVTNSRFLLRDSGIRFRSDWDDPWSKRLAKVPLSF